MSEPRPITTNYVSMLKILEKYGLLDDTGHMNNCGYTDEKPECKCATLGADIHNELAAVFDKGRAFAPQDTTSQK